MELRLDGATARNGDPGATQARALAKELEWFLTQAVADFETELTPIQGLALDLWSALLARAEADVSSSAARQALEEQTWGSRRTWA